MAVVKVRVVCVSVGQGPVPMPVRVRFDHRAVMRVLVMCVVNVRMLMLERLVGMLVLVSLRHVQP
jgi:hypothetical protein